MTAQMAYLKQQIESARSGNREAVDSLRRICQSASATATLSELIAMATYLLHINCKDK